MADDTREKLSSTAPSAVAGLPKKLPKGMILGKDGKPCRSCNSFADFTSQTKSITKSPFSTSTVAKPPSFCPPDVEVLGRSTWTFLHSLTASYPEVPSASEQKDVKQFMGLFGKLYPCWVCAEDFQVWMESNRIRTESRDEFGRWMCEAHNEVNQKLGKRAFDCNKWEERWRTGWKDGSCD